MSDPSPCVFERALLRHSHPMFDLGEDLFNGVEIRGVGRQEPEPSPCGANGVSHGLAFVAPQIVENDDVARLKRGDQDLFDIGAEREPVDRTIEHAGRRQAIHAQSGQEGHGAPMAVRRITLEPPPFRTPAAQGRHIGLDPRLIDEHQPGRIEPSLPGLPALPLTGNRGPSLLKREQAFF